MKALTLLFFLLPLVSIGQTDSQRLEKASYEITKNGANSYVTHIEVNDVISDLDFVKESFYAKEGVFYVSFGESSKILYVHHYALVDYNTIADLSKEIIPGADVLYTAPTRIKNGLLIEVTE